LGLRQPAQQLALHRFSKIRFQFSLHDPFSRLTNPVVNNG